MAKHGLRTIGLCYKEIPEEHVNLEDKDSKGVSKYETDGFTLVGIAGIKDIIRPEVPDNIKQCRKAGIDVKMVTGDNKITARAIGKEIGLIDKDH